MFSEYASKFLAQSQSRLSNFGQPPIHDGDASMISDTAHRPRNDWQSSARGGQRFGRSFLARGFAATAASGNPYQTTTGSRFGQLNFSRYGGPAQDAPLFHSTRGDIHEDLEENEDEDDDDEIERDREAADLYALQRSRRVFAAGRLEDSAGTENEHSRTTLGDSRSDDEEHLAGSGRQERERAAQGGPAGSAGGLGLSGSASASASASAPTEGRPPRGLKGSWKGGRSIYRSGEADNADRWEDRTGRKGRAAAPANQRDDSSDYGGLHGSRERMEDIGLESTIADSEPPEDLTVERAHDDHDGDQPPTFQKFHPSSQTSRFGYLRQSVGDSSHAEAELLRDHRQGQDTDSEAGRGALATEAVVAPGPADGELFRHDPFFAWVYLVAMAALFATFVLVYLHTMASRGDQKKPWGDSIYTTLLSSFHLLAVDTLVAVVVSLVWLAALRSFARHMVMLILVAVPVIMLSFSIYPFVASFQGGAGAGGDNKERRRSLQDVVMRWAALVPAVGAALWVYLVWRGRAALRSAVAILEFSSRILAANSALVLVGMGCLAVVVLWTWVWLAMFTRVFLGGSFSSQLSRFVLRASSWWLGAWFVVMYLWTLAVVAGVQRGTTGATVSQWYFHRSAQPAPSSAEVVSAALHHAVTTIFGSVCLSTLLALAVRLPLLVLPRRLADALGLFFYSFVPTSMAALTNPLTLTYAAIHSQSLAQSAQGLSLLDFLSPDAPTTTLTPRAFYRPSARRRGAGAASSAPLLPYRLAKLLLHATRFIMATALGFAGWVITARQLRIAMPDNGSGFGGSIRGSAYAYVVGLVASFIGWGVLGAMEGILSGIVDAVVICYGSETRMANGGGGYCMEAAYLFGGRNGAAGAVDVDDAYRRRDVY